MPASSASAALWWGCRRGSEDFEETLGFLDVLWPFADGEEDGALRLLFGSTPFRTITTFFGGMADVAEIVKAVLNIVLERTEWLPCVRGDKSDDSANLHPNFQAVRVMSIKFQNRRNS